MRYVHDGKLLKYKQSIGVEKIDDNNYCFVYSYCSSKDQYSKKTAREVLEKKCKVAIRQMDKEKDCSITIHTLNNSTVIDSIIITQKYLSNLIYNIYFPKGIITALSKHSNMQLFERIDLLKFESKELRKLAFDLRQYITSSFNTAS